MKNLLRSSVILVLLAIYGCQSTPETKQVGYSVLQTYKAEDIIVRRSADYSEGAGVFGKDERAFLAQQFADFIRDQMPGEMKYSLIGEKPARVIVDLDSVIIATGAGRELNGADSVIKSRVSVVDISTNKVVASSFVGAVDAGAKNNSYVGNVPVGAIASFIENRNSGAAGSRITKIGSAYMRELRQVFRP